MLFIGPWHILIVIGVFLGATALVSVWGILWAAWTALEHRQDEEER